MTAHQPPRPAARAALWIALSGAVLVGVLTAGQARINGQLGMRLQDGLVAALVSFGSGLAILTIVSVCTREGREGFRTLRSGIAQRRIPWWMLLGGAAGALTVGTQGLTVATIGVSLFTVGVVAGQAVSGLVLDRIGYGPAGVVAITLGRLAGGLLALAAIGVSLTGDVLSRTAWWMLLLPFLAGAGIGWQQATNGRLRVAVGTPLTATLVNFIGGTAILAVASGVSVLVSGPPAGFPTEPWLYVGGAMGVVYIFLSAAIVARTGVLLLGLASVVGQIVTSVILDAIWPARGGVGAVQASLMVFLALASVLVATVPWRRLRRGRPRHA